MGLNIGGYEDRPDWPKMGPSLLIATCLILAIRTARWPTRSADSTVSNVDLEREMEHAAIFPAGFLLDSFRNPPASFRTRSALGSSRMMRMNRAEPHSRALLT